MARLEIPSFETKKELFAFLVEKKSELESQKKSAIKFADGIGATTVLINGEIERGGVNKADASDENINKDEIKVKAIINTTNLLDSHGDVHIPGLWSKSLKENKRILFCQRQ